MKFSLPFSFNNTYVQNLPNLGQSVDPARFENAQWVSISNDVASMLGTDSATIRVNDQWLDWFSGKDKQPGSAPFAQKYTGHQFGQYNPELGDGRGVLLGEAQTANGRWDIHVKGAGQTPFSRFGDGRAVLRSCIREYLASESLGHLGIATSRALGLFTTGEQVQRETIEAGAALIRVCESHIRFGHFEYAFYQNNTELLEQLVHYTTSTVMPADSIEMQQLDTTSTMEQRAYQMLKFTIRTTAEMIAKWQAYGFCHGVMNTDNMSILGLTFDYGPYGFLDVFDPTHICNHSDHSGRYAFEEQPSIGLWNLNALGYALSPILDKDTLAELLKQYEPILLENYSTLIRRKLGFTQKLPQDQQLLGEFLQLMQSQKRDYTETWRVLSHVRFAEKNEAMFVDTFIDREAAQQWLNKYKQRTSLELVNDDERCKLMLSSNPKYVLRNYLAQETIEAAEQGNYAPLDELLNVLSRPFDEQEESSRYAKLPPDWASELDISCSS